MGYVMEIEKNYSKEKKVSADQTPQFKENLERHLNYQKRQFKERSKMLKIFTQPRL